MTHDTNRNRAYASGIKNAANAIYEPAEGKKNKGTKMSPSSSLKRRRESLWLEIGPGAHACLTQMVLQHDGTRIIAVEGNSGAARGADRILKSRGLHPRVTIHTGLSTDPAVTAKLKDVKFDAVVQELLGYFAGSEGGAYCMAKLLEDVPGIASSILIPSCSGSFLCPALVSETDLNVGSDLYVSAGCFALVRRLAIGRVSRATGGSGRLWEGGRLFEWLDFADLELRQKRVMTFVSDTDALVNGLATWLWAETSPGAPATVRGSAATSPDSTSQFRSPRVPRVLTSFPYGDASAPIRFLERNDFSSNIDDGQACASNWRNAFLPFRNTVLVPAGKELTVTATCQLHTQTPAYRFIVTLDSQLISDIQISVCAPTFVHTANQPKPRRLV
jgi:hypothetical protein